MPGLSKIMKERARYGIGLALLLLTAAVLILLNAEKKEQRHAVSFPAMGTVATLTFYTDETTFLKAVTAVREVFEKITAVANVHDSQSELSRLNKEAGKAPFVCSPLMWELLKESRLAYELSEGAFDISVKPLLDHWGFYKKRIKNQLFQNSRNQLKAHNNQGALTPKTWLNPAKNSELWDTLALPT